ncbi:hypothetical protein BU23DRAFT_487819 [Bimuria novae-zelandiae CBS 107.79]|uniref:PLAC8-domain-containing protein n=1 Tax=Bimuria novae-zelandiae CBS 107.79 TaxID=1447943 RepID=A0A6A5UN03_9PLEO|nr:hypothetical protein BU23DRAFT_487819 [Bimuria novae-zelandiae CBS 107.79]
MSSKQDWHHSALSCCSPISICCLGWLCPCMLYGRTRHRLKHNGNVGGFSSCNVDCCTYAMVGLCGMAGIFNAMQRSDIRTKYQLGGNSCTDCIRGCLCTPCDLIHQEKECVYQKEKIVEHEPGRVQHMHYSQS